jgi:lipid-A-disaccharide synthase
VTAPAAAALRVFIVAGEESGDRLGAPLMRALAERATVSFSGVGGAEMARAGLESLFAIDELAIFGFSAIPAKLPMILRRIRETAAAVIATKPDVLVIIDSPDFTHRVARKVRAALPDLPIVDYVSPSVWAWRPGRARAMRGYVDHVLALLPFEPAAHARLGGPPCTYVGHPLSEAASALRPAEADARRRSLDPPLVLVLPGSRSGEIARHLDLFGATVTQLRADVGALEIVLPTVPHYAKRIEAATASWPQPPRIVVDVDAKRAAFRCARAALAASGTVTLELAVAGVPTVVAYRVSLLEEMVANLFIRVPTIVLANLVLGDNVMPEILQRQATPVSLARELAPLIGETPQRARQLAAFARLDSVMEIGAASPSARAANIVLDVASRRR